MGYFFIVAGILIVIGFFYIYFTPSVSLRPLAQLAEERFSSAYFTMRMRGIDGEEILTNLAKARKIGVLLDLRDLIEYQMIGGDVNKVVQALIEAKQGGLRIGIDDLKGFCLSGGDVQVLVKAMQAVKNSELKIAQSVLEILALNGGDIERFVGLVIKTKRAGLNLDLKELVEHKINDEDMDKIGNALIRVLKAGLYLTEEERQKLEKEENKDSEKVDLRISLKGILKHYRANIDIDQYVDAMIKAKKGNLEIDKQLLDLHYLTNGDLIQLVQTMIEAERAGLDINQDQLVRHNIIGKDMTMIVEWLIKLHQSGIELPVDDLIEYYRMSGNVKAFAEALITAKKSGLNIDKKELESHHLAGADVKRYVKARAIIEQNPQLGVSIDDINNQYIKGGDPLAVLWAIELAQKNNIALSWGLASAIDLLPDKDIAEAVRWALHPQNIDIEPIQLTTKNGYLIEPKLKATVRGKIELYLNGSREESIYIRIHDALVEEVSRYQTHTDILNNLADMGQNILALLQGSAIPIKTDGKDKFTLRNEIEHINKKQNKLNQSSAYEVLDVIIPAVNVIEDTMAAVQLKKAIHENELGEKHAEHMVHMAHAREADAKVKLLEARAEMHKGMAEAFKKGGLPYKDYIKMEHIYNQENDSSQRKEEQH